MRHAKILDLKMSRPPHYFCDDDVLFPALLLLVGPPPPTGLRLRPGSMDQVPPSSRYETTTRAGRQYKADVDTIVWPMAQDIYRDSKQNHRAKKSHQRRNEFILWVLYQKKTK